MNSEINHDEKDKIKKTKIDNSEEDIVKKEPDRVKRNLRGAFYMLVVLCAIVIGISLWGTKVIKKDHNTHVTEGNFYQYMGSERIDYSGSISIERLDEDDRCVLTNDDYISDIDGTPLYFDKEEKLYTLNECIYVDPVSYAPQYVDMYTEVFLKGDVPWVKTKDKSIPLDGGFLYDGKDMFIFLEPVTLHYLDEEISLSALSYCNVTCGLEMLFYSYVNHQYMQKEIAREDEITATFADGRSIDLNADILYDQDGNWQLLVTTPAISKPLN